jgi:hypothetical protein
VLGTLVDDLDGFGVFTSSRASASSTFRFLICCVH